MIGEIRDFLTGSKDIIEARMYELGGYGYAGESYSDDEGYDYDLIGSYIDYEIAEEAYMNNLSNNIDFYGSAFESTQAASENKMGFFQKMKQKFITWCYSMFQKCNRKSNETKNSALKKIFKTFAKVFLNSYPGKLKELLRKMETLMQQYQKLKSVKKKEKMLKPK